MIIPTKAELKWQVKIEGQTLVVFDNSTMFNVLQNAAREGIHYVRVTEMHRCSFVSNKWFPYTERTIDPTKPEEVNRVLYSHEGRL